jgi:ribonucleotide monophosphatase NagD (HAD superfamily)
MFTIFFILDQLRCDYAVSGGGSMVGALVGSTQREPLVVGKPSTFMMDY